MQQICIQIATHTIQKNCTHVHVQRHETRLQSIATVLLARGDAKVATLERDVSLLGA